MPLTGTARKQTEASTTYTRFFHHRVYISTPGFNTFSRSLENFSYAQRAQTDAYRQRSCGHSLRSPTGTKMTAVTWWPGFYEHWLDDCPLVDYLRSTLRIYRTFSNIRHSNYCKLITSTNRAYPLAPACLNL